MMKSEALQARRAVGIDYWHGNTNFAAHGCYVSYLDWSDFSECISQRFETLGIANPGVQQVLELRRRPDSYVIRVITYVVQTEFHYGNDFTSGM